MVAAEGWMAELVMIDRLRRRFDNLHTLLPAFFQPLRPRSLVPRPPATPTHNLVLPLARKTHLVLAPSTYTPYQAPRHLPPWYRHRTIPVHIFPPRPRSPRSHSWRSSLGIHAIKFPLLAHPAIQVCLHGGVHGHTNAA